MSFYDRFGSLKSHRGHDVYQIVGDTNYDAEVVNLAEQVSYRYVKVPAGWSGRPDLVANAIFGNPALWPDILAANAIHDPFEFKGNMIIKIPVRL